MTFWAYILRCADDSYYTGQTDDLERRLAEHHAGAIAGYTADRRPVALVWSESFAERDEARAAEHRIKPWSRAKKEALIRGDWKALSSAATPPRERVERASAALGARPSTSLGMDGESAQKIRESAAPPPAIVLVRPQLGENIGKAARAMLNFGLTDLRLVSPRDGWPNPAAGPAASGADAVLADARVFPDVAAATADCAHVLATTVRKRGVTKPVLDPAQAAGAIRAGPGRAAILFGAERSGLETDEVAIARTIVTVPVNPAFGSLNLAQAVILLAYEWSKAEALPQPPKGPLDPPAPQAELEGMIAQLDAMLARVGYHYPHDRAPVTRRTLRTVLTKPGWTSQEVRTLRGVLSALERPRAR